MGEITLRDCYILYMLHFPSVHGSILIMHPGRSKQKLVRLLLNAIHMALNLAQTNRCVKGSLNVH